MPATKGGERVTGSNTEHPESPGELYLMFSPTCVQVPHHVDTGSNGHGAVDEGGAGLDAQVLVIQEHPPAAERVSFLLIMQS